MPGASSCRVSRRIDALLWPDLVIIGGGISKDAEHFIKDLPTRVRCVPATLENRAGHRRARMLAAEASKLTARRHLPGSPEWRRWPPERRRDQEHDADGYLPIEQHGVIANLHTVALVGSEGTIDWFCPERFDAPSMSARSSTRQGRPASRSARERRVHDEAALLPDGRGSSPLLHRGRRRRGRRLHAARARHCSIVRRIEVGRGVVRFPRRVRAQRSTTPARRTASHSRTRSRCSSPATPCAKLRRDRRHARGRGRSSGCRGHAFARGSGPPMSLGGVVGPRVDMTPVEAAFRRRSGSGAGGSRRAHGVRWREVVDPPSAITLNCSRTCPPARSSGAHDEPPRALAARANWDYRYCGCADSAVHEFAFRARLLRPSSGRVHDLGTEGDRQSSVRSVQPAVRPRRGSQAQEREHRERRSR